MAPSSTPNEKPDVLGRIERHPPLQSGASLSLRECFSEQLSGPQALLVLERSRDTSQTQALTGLQAALQGQDFLLLLIDEARQGFHVLQGELKDHSFLQVTQSLESKEISISSKLGQAPRRGH